jgi:hypothetical protein
MHIYKWLDCTMSSRRRMEHKLFFFWIHHNLKKNIWIFLFQLYALQMTMKRCTKFQVSQIGHLQREESTSYFTPTTYHPSGSRIIGSSCPNNMQIPQLTIKCCTKYQVSDQPSRRKSELNYFTSSTPLRSTKEKKVDPPFPAIYTSWNANEAPLKFYDSNQQSLRKSEHEVIHTLHLSWIHHSRNSNWIFTIEPMSLFLLLLSVDSFVWWKGYNSLLLSHSVA